MAFTATLDSVQRGEDPATFDLGVTYRDSTSPDWSVSKILRTTIDPTLTPAQQRNALVALVKADALPYQKQQVIYAELLALVGQSVQVP